MLSYFATAVGGLRAAKRNRDLRMPYSGHQVETLIVFTVLQWVIIILPVQLGIALHEKAG